jgi:hypothetical protein
VGKRAADDRPDPDSPNVRRTGILVLRVSFEETPATRLRIRITQVLDISQPREIVITVLTVEEAEAAIHSWLEAFAAD